MSISTCADNEIVALLGRSGSGKSTLLRIISGLLTPSEGKVTIDGEPVNGPADGVAMVFQTFALFPWLTVLENVELGLEAQGLPRRSAASALQAIDLIGLDGFETAYPKELPAVCASASASHGGLSCIRKSCLWTSRSRRLTCSRRRPCAPNSSTSGAKAGCRHRGILMVTGQYEKRRC